MKATVKYAAIGLTLLGLDLIIVIIGGWLDMPTLSDLSQTIPQRLFDATLGIASLATIVWWAPTSLAAIAFALLAEHYHIAKIIALIPALALLWFQPRMALSTWTRIRKLIKRK